MIDNFIFSILLIFILEIGETVRFILLHSKTIFSSLIIYKEISSSSDSSVQRFFLTEYLEQLKISFKIGKLDIMIRVRANL